MAVAQLVSEDGAFNEGFEDFVQRNRIHQAGTDYQIVAITGPQSSGKSTLMNTVFGTSFQEMDAMSGRSQTTKGIWLAQSDKFVSPSTLVIDLEGSDGRERGEDDSSFERRSSLFALAVADVLVVNMWAKDVGREAGAGKPLLKTIFQVNLKLFAPDPNKQKTVLLFVFRDRTKTPLSRLVETWEADLNQMWDSLTKPPQYEGKSFTDFFEVKYSSLPNFEDREEEFKAESVLLRRRFTLEDDHSLVRPSSNKLPGNVLTMSFKKIWEVIKDQKDLNLPAHKVMVANVRCEEIMLEKLILVRESEQWQLLAERSTSQLVADFGSQAQAILEACLTGYDGEARYFEEGVRSSKRAELAAKVGGELKIAFDKQLKILHELSLDSAKQSIAKADDAQFMNEARSVMQQTLERYDDRLEGLAVPGVAWDTSTARQEVETEVDEHIDHIRSAKVAEVEEEAEKALHKSTSGPVIALIDKCPPDLWPRVIRVLRTALEKQVQGVNAQLDGYELSSEATVELHQRLASYVYARVATHFQEAANTILSRMKDRFTERFSRDEDALPRRWGPSENISVAMQKAYQDVSVLLAQIAVLRLGESKASQAIYKVVDEGVQSLASSASSKHSSPDRAHANGQKEFDIQEASEWPGLGEDKVFLTPAACRQVWRQFTSDSSFVVQQAQATQEAKRAASNRMPPFWAVAAIAILGMNEFLTVLYNPLWLIVVGVLVLFVSTVYKELDVDGEMAAGLLPGTIALAHKFVPTVTQVARNSVQAVTRFAADPGQFASGQRQQVREVELQESDGSDSTAAGEGTPHVFQTPQTVRQRAGFPLNGSYSRTPASASYS